MSAGNKRSFGISLIGMGPGQIAVLKSMLLMLEGRLSTGWQIEEDQNTGNAGVLIINSDSLDGAIALAGQTLAPGKILAVFRDPAASVVVKYPKDATLLDAPLRVMNLLDVLNEVALKLDSSIVEASSKAPQIAQSKPNAFILALHEMKGRGVGVFRMRIEQHELIFFCAEKKIYFTGMTADLLAAAESDTLSVLPVAAGDAVLQQAGENASPWDSVLWSLGLGAGQGKLLTWLASNCTYKLRRWPDTSLLKNRSSFVRLAARFAKEFVSPEEVAQKSGAANRDIADFLNACSLCGYLISGERKQTLVEETLAAPAASEQKKSLFGRIRSKLGL